MVLERNYSIYKKKKATVIKPAKLFVRITKKYHRLGIINFLRLLVEFLEIF